MKRPTNRMNEYLEAIKKFMQENGYSPTIRELGAMLGLTSTSTIQNMLTRMREKGLIDFVDYQSRTITLKPYDKNSIEYYDIDDINGFKEEIERLTNELDRANSKLKESIAIRLKAINYIKEHREKQYGFNYEYNLEDKEIEVLLEILEGKDNVKD